MVHVLVKEVIHDRILVSRESAHLLEQHISKALAAAGTLAQITVDFQGIDGMAPSFLDELLSIFASMTTEATDKGQMAVVIANPPSRLSSKFEAVARGRSVAIELLPNGCWLLRGRS